MVADTIPPPNPAIRFKVVRANNGFLIEYAGGGYEGKCSGSLVAHTADELGNQIATTAARLLSPTPKGAE